MNAFKVANEAEHNLRGVILLLNLPDSSSVVLDGVRRTLSNKAELESNFIAIRGLQSSILHLCIVTSPPSGRSGQETLPHASAIVLLPSNDEDRCDSKSICRAKLIAARAYDDSIEELSSADMTDKVYGSGLWEAILHDSERVKRFVIKYDDFVAFPCDYGLEINSGTTTNISARELWEREICYINAKLLEKRGIKHGIKLVPRNQCDLNEDSYSSGLKNKANEGTWVSYPPIPCIDVEFNGKYEGMNFLNEPNKKLQTGDSLFLRRAMQHDGTKEFFKRLSPSERTQILLKQNNLCIGSSLLLRVLQKHYGEQWQLTLGDLQLSFLLFVHLHCASSLEHWRDLIICLSLAGEDLFATTHSELIVHLYTGLMDVLSTQMSSLENGHVEDMELFSGTSFVLAFRRIHVLVSTLISSSSSNTHLQKSLEMQKSLFRFEKVLFERSLLDLKQSRLHQASLDEADTFRTINCSLAPCDALTPVTQDLSYEFDEESETGPLIVDPTEIERACQPIMQDIPPVEITNTQMGNFVGSGSECKIGQELKTRFPLLYGSVLATQGKEDFVMACARILSDQNDVSLVREAASYLKQVEVEFNQYKR